MQWIIFQILDTFLIDGYHFIRLGHKVLILKAQLVDTAIILLIGSNVILFSSIKFCEQIAVLLDGVKMLDLL